MASKHTQAWCIDEHEYADLPDLSAKIAFLVRYAVLAPSPWNSQPWRFRLDGNRLELYEVPERFQEHRDPEGREHNIGCGAALANLLIAAKHFNLYTALQIYPSGVPEHCIATVTFTERETPTLNDMSEEERQEQSLNNRLFEAIPKRRSYRQDFLDKPVGEWLCKEMEDIAARFDVSFVPLPSYSTKLALAGLVSEGDRYLGADKDTRKEYASWIRSNENKGDGVPGYALGLSSWASMLAPATHRLFDFTDENAHKDKDLTTNSTALCAVFMGTEDNCAGWMNCGLALQHVLLLAASHGIQASFLNQIIPVPELRTRLSELLGRKDVPQTVIRLGFPPETDIKPTPRLPFEDVMIEP